MEWVKYDEKNENIIYEQISPDLQVPFKMGIVDIQEGDDRCQIQKHWHRSLEIIVAILGECEAWVDGETYYAPPGDFIIINSKSIHSCRSFIPKQRCYGYTIQIKYEFLESCFKDIEDNYIDPYCAKNHDTIKNLLDQIFEMAYKSDKKMKHLLLNGLLYELVYQLLEYNCYKKEGQPSSLKHSEKIREIMSYLEQRSDDNFTIDDLSRHFNLSYGYIAKIFKENLNMTIGEYINYIRIQKIEKELQLTDKSITDICLSHGFTNTKSFYREFNKYHSQTPKQYRNEIKNKR